LIVKERAGLDLVDGANAPRPMVLFQDKQSVAPEFPEADGVGLDSQREMRTFAPPVPEVAVQQLMVFARFPGLVRPGMTFALPDLPERDAKSGTLLRARERTEARARHAWRVA
jgi:hypothetical protein